VDDSEQSRQILENIIVNGGYEYLGIGDSVEAIPLLLERQPQLIFLDLIMPNINGYELCSQIRKISSLKEIPIVIVTGNDGIVDRMRAKVVGANNFISKPIDRSEVLTLAVQYTQAHFSGK
jgi:chemotaxis family two-component system response regulator PixG